jgi:uncharacterized protein YndB with AHSA1/START domain
MKFDIPAQLGLVTRQVRAREHQGQAAHVVAARRDYDTSIADLWDALTSPERIPRWFLPISGELRVGGRYQLQGNAGGTIETCTPPRHLAVSWEFGAEVSWLELRLSEQGSERTRLELEHLVPVNEHWQKFGPGAVGVGWDLTLHGLGRHLASGVAVDPAQAMAWMGSAEGKAFLAHSSDDWCRAAMASGTPASVAQPAAARTTAAYTGAPAPSGESGSAPSDT